MADKIRVGVNVLMLLSGFLIGYEMGKYAQLPLAYPLALAFLTGVLFASYKILDEIEGLKNEN